MSRWGNWSRRNRLGIGVFALVLAVALSAGVGEAGARSAAQLIAPRADIAVWRPSNGFWYVRGGVTQQWGASSDVPVSGDYNGDGNNDIAVWRPSNGFWYVNGGVTRQWGAPSDIPVPGDYDGDGDTDIAVWRPSNGFWYVNGGVTRQWGAPTDIPVPGDYDGDGDTDIAVWRPSNGFWYVNGGVTRQWGAPTDVPVPGNYDGDADTDIAVWRPGNGFWYVNGGATVQWGARADIPVPGNYDGDGDTDFAVWRPATGVWYVNGGETVQWGSLTDAPVVAPPWYHVLYPRDARATYVFNAGVAAEQQSVIRRGIDIAAAYFRSGLDRDLPPITVYADDDFEGIVNLYAQTRPTSIENSRLVWQTTTATAAPRRTWVYTGSTSWRPDNSRQKIMVHEAFHIMQFELAGSTALDADQDSVPRAGPIWLVEGAAEYIGYRGIASAALIQMSQIRSQWISRTKLITTPLRSLETSRGFSAVSEPYQISPLAVDFLLAGRSDTLLVAYYEAIGRGVAWPSAFATVFGRSIDTFYAEFEAYRAGL